MGRGLVVLFVIGCGGPSAAPEPRTFEFGPYTLAAGQELSNQCVSATLDNDEPLYISAVELTTATGFHHSNWFTVPESMFDGPDGTWRCSDSGYDEAIAGIAGGVLFAQSTQAVHEVQQFPAGTAIVVPARSRIVAGTHLLNTGDDPISLGLSLKITPIVEPPTLLAAMSFVNESISIPAMRKSRMTVDCDIGASHQTAIGRPIDFTFVYALAHYHDLGTGITIEAVKSDGTATTVFETANRVGDTLGGTIDPAFSMEGFARLRFSCDFDNTAGTNTVRWGLGNGEMCVFLAFTDSDKTWGGGVLNRNGVPTIVDHGAFIEHTYECIVINSEPIR
jgi:hypothetical protein